MSDRNRIKHVGSDLQITATARRVCYKCPVRSMKKFLTGHKIDWKWQVLCCFDKKWNWKWLVLKTQTVSHSRADIKSGSTVSVWFDCDRVCLINCPHPAFNTSMWRRNLSIDQTLIVSHYWNSMQECNNEVYSMLSCSTPIFIIRCVNVKG